MRTAKLFEIGEEVLVTMTVVNREFDERGNIKYKLKDNKTGKILDWNYSDKEIVPAKTNINDKANDKSK